MKNLHEICLEIFNIVQFIYSLNPKRPIKINLRIDRISVVYAWTIIWSSNTHSVDQLTYDFFKEKMEEVEQRILS